MPIPMPTPMPMDEWLTMNNLEAASVEDDLQGNQNQESCLKLIVRALILRLAEPDIGSIQMEKRSSFMH